MSSDTTIELLEPPYNADPDKPRRLSLVMLFSQFEPERTGEVCLIPGRLGDSAVIGRGPKTLPWCRMRPGQHAATGPLLDPSLSRDQVQCRQRREDRLRVKVTGRLTCFVNGERVTDETWLGPGDLVRLGSRYIFEVTLRPTFMSTCRLPERYWPDFGEPDEVGLIGESPWSWELRGRLFALAQDSGHTVVFGPSGSGKELVARALHRYSSRALGPWVARNAASIPEPLVSAELFGNVQGYPNAGMPSRKGLVGQADGGVLVLDEFAELSEAAQANLLRVMDNAGSYQRLGDSRDRQTDMRIIALTNRPEDAIKHDVLARFSHRIRLTALASRRQDLGLIARHELQRSGPSSGSPESGVDRDIFERLWGLFTAPLPDNVRGIRRRFTVAYHATHRDDVAEEQPLLPSRDPKSLLEQEVNDALEANPRSRDAAARALGLKNRYALYRAMRRLGLKDP